MPTNKELQELLAAEKKINKELKGQIETLTRERQEAQDQIGDPQVKGVPGYLIETPEVGYSGVTFAMGRGIQFRRGRAVVLDGPETPGIISIMRGDYGYKCTHLKDVHNSQEIKDIIENELIEISQ